MKGLYRFRLNVSIPVDSLVFDVVYSGVKINIVRYVKMYRNQEGGPKT